MKKLFFETLFICLILLLGYTSGNASSPLKVHPANWRYFMDSSGNTVLFSGSHTWMRKEVEKHYNPNGWDIDKFNKYLNFLEYWNHNYIRLWMWEHQGDVDIWVKNANDKYDLTQLNPEYFELVRSFVDAASSRGIYCSVMLFQGWSGCNSGSKPDWPRHPMYKNNNVNGIDGDPEGIGYGIKVHSLANQEIVKYQEMYIEKMVEILNGYDNIIWEIGNEIAYSGLAWKDHVVNYIRKLEKHLPKQHLILESLAYGGNNDAEWTTPADSYCPGALFKWNCHDEIYLTNPPEPDVRLKKPVILDSDHIGNIFSDFSPYEQRSWTWKSFTRGNHVVHMDAYDTGWYDQEPKPNHPVNGVATYPGFDPQRKSMGDIIRFAKKVDIAAMVPVVDSSFCSTTYCLASDKDCIIYQPKVKEPIWIFLSMGDYQIESFDPIDNSTSLETFHWEKEKKKFDCPLHIKEDWILLIKRIK